MYSQLNLIVFYVMLLVIVAVCNDPTFNDPIKIYWPWQTYVLTNINKKLLFCPINFKILQQVKSSAVCEHKAAAVSFAALAMKV